MGRGSLRGTLRSMNLFSECARRIVSCPISTTFTLQNDVYSSSVAGEISASGRNHDDLLCEEGTRRVYY